MLSSMHQYAHHFDASVRVNRIPNLYVTTPSSSTLPDPPNNSDVPNAAIKEANLSISLPLKKLLSFYCSRMI